MTLPAEARMLLEMALAEDVGSGDRTTLWTFPAGTPGEADIVAKAPGTIAGMPVCVAAFHAVEYERFGRLVREFNLRVN